MNADALQKMHHTNHNEMKCDTRRELQQAIEKYGYPVMLKARHGAYDGRGNFPIRSETDIELAVQALCKSDEITPGQLYCERWVKFDKELAVMVCKEQDGTMTCYSVVETVQCNSICHLVVAPAKISQRATDNAIKVARNIVGNLSGYGMFGVELFLIGGHTIEFNEIAPRAHNSGHYTIEGCHSSQFVNHIKAVCGLPIGSTQMQHPNALMINLIGTIDDTE